MAHFFGPELEIHCLVNIELYSFKEKGLKLFFLNLVYSVLKIMFSDILMWELYLLSFLLWTDSSFRFSLAEVSLFKNDHENFPFPVMSPSGNVES